MNEFYILEAHPLNMVYVGRIQKATDDEIFLESASFNVRNYPEEPIDNLKETFLYLGNACLMEVNVIKCDESWDAWTNQVFHNIFTVRSDKDIIQLKGILEYKKLILQVFTTDKRAIEMYKDKAWFALWDYLQ